MGSVIGNYAPDNTPLLVRAVRGSLKEYEYVEPIVVPAESDVTSGTEQVQEQTAPAVADSSDGDGCFLAAANAVR